MSVTVHSPDSIFDVTKRPYNAKGDLTNATTRIQAAIDDAASAGGGTILLPIWDNNPGRYLAPGLVVSDPGIRITGQGRSASQLITNSGHLLTLSGNAQKLAIEHLLLRSSSGGGHLIKVDAGLTGLSRALFFELSLLQENNGSAYFYQDNGDYINNLWLHIDAQHTAAATVAGWYIHTPAVNENKWDMIIPTYSGSYVFDIETTAVSSYANGNTFSNITSEVNAGGLIKMRGGQGTKISDVGIYDLGTSTKDLIDLGTSGSGILTFNTTIDNVRRHGGTLGSGLYDVVWAGSSFTPRLLLTNCGGSTPLQVNANSKLITLIECPNVVVTNGEFVTAIGSAGSRFVTREVTSSESVAPSLSKQTITDKKGSGTTTYTLPATERGLEYTFICGNAAGEIAVSPNANDKIMGKGITAADDKDYVNTGATNAVGDLVKIIGDGIDGWWVVEERGIWAREA